MINTKCFAFNNEDCKCLNNFICKSKPCRFAKTKSDLENENKKSFERIRSLSDFQQKTISEQYFDNKMPWFTKE